MRVFRIRAWLVTLCSTLQAPCPMLPALGPRLLALCSLLLAPCSLLLAQEDCQQKLEEANRAYYNGQLSEIESILGSCVQSGFDKPDKQDALKLLINSSLVLAEDERADTYMAQFLVLNPQYELREVDLVEFRKLYSTYEIKTQYTLGLSGGILLPDYVIMRHHSYGGQAEQPSDYQENTGFSVGATGDLRLYKDIYWNWSVLYTYRSFKQEEIILGYQKVASHEREYLLDIPLQARYIFDLPRYRPFVGFGYALHILLKAKGDIDHLPLQPEFPTIIGVPFSTDGYNLTDQRKRYAHNWVASAGMQVAFDLFLAEFRIMYERGLTNLVNSGARHTDRELLDTYAYVPDDYKVNSLTVSLVLVRNILKPKKIKP